MATGSCDYIQLEANETPIGICYLNSLLQVHAPDETSHNAPHDTDGLLESAAI